MPRTSSTRHRYGGREMVRRRSLQGTTLVYVVVVVAIIATVGLIATPLVRYASAKVEFDGLNKQLTWTDRDRAAYEEAAKILLASGAGQRISNQGDSPYVDWFNLAVGNGYAGRDPRQGGGCDDLWQSNLRFRPWADVQASKLPPAETVWGWEIHETRRRNTADYTIYSQAPYVPSMCRTRLAVVTKIVTPPGKARWLKVFERVGLVVMADGSTRLCTLAELERLGLTGEVRAYVWTGDYYPAYLTYYDWEKKLAKTPSEGRFGNISWRLVAAYPPPE